MIDLMLVQMRKMKMIILTETTVAIETIITEETIEITMEIKKEPYGSLTF